MGGFGPFDTERTAGGDNAPNQRREDGQGWLLVLLLGIATVTVALSTGVATAGARDFSFLRLF